MAQPVLRFAPSPNGRLHLGHAYSALLNEKLAHELGGRLLLRLEDIDTTRCTPELVQHCLDDLRWLGLVWEEPVRVQSQHFSDYRAALEKLKTRDVAYPCFCSRSEIAAASTATDPDGAPIYPGTCRQKNLQHRMHEPHSWRLDMHQALRAAPGPHRYERFTTGETITTDPTRWGDVILARKEIPTSYHLSVVVDDALQGVTHIVRGQDLEAATDLHVLLQALLRLPTPLYHHHGLLREAAGEKLSKSKGSETLADLRGRGLTAMQVRTMAFAA